MSRGKRGSGRREWEVCAIVTTNTSCKKDIETAMIKAISEMPTVISIESIFICPAPEAVRMRSEVQEKRLLEQLHKSLE